MPSHPCNKSVAILSSTKTIFRPHISSGDKPAIFLKYNRSRMTVTIRKWSWTKQSYEIYQLEILNCQWSKKEKCNKNARGLLPKTNIFKPYGKMKAYNLFRICDNSGHTFSYIQNEYTEKCCIKMISRSER